MNVLILAEHDNAALNPLTQACVSAAQALNSTIDVLVLGYQCQAVAETAARINSVNKVLLCDNVVFQHQLAENSAQAIFKIIGPYDYVLAPASTFGKNIMPYLAALCDVSPISDVNAIVAADTFKRPIYAGNAVATVKSSAAKKLLTIRTTAFAAAALHEQLVTIETLNLADENSQTTFVSTSENKSERPELPTARCVVSGGRGLQTKENFSLIMDLADKLGAAVGASRAAVDAGLVPNDWQVGQTGKIVAPDLYIAVGISGAIQHVAGIKDSKVIVAINKDADAPIFDIADYGLVGDLFEIIPELSAKLNAK